MEWILAHKEDLVLIYTSLVTIGSVIVKLLPEFKEKSWAKAITRFIGKYVALNR